MIACSAAPATRRQYYLPSGVRSRLWFRGEWLPSRDAGAFLWLHLDDRRVLAFRLPAETFEHDGAIRELLEQVAEDHRGTVLEARLGDDVAIPLYAVPATPLPMLPWGDPRHGAARDFATALDQEVLALLASLNRHRCWDSLRNYNRLAALAPVLRERRLQALRRFPLLVAPILLSAHQGFDFGGGKRHAWRDHDDAVIEAVERGRDLTGALARHYAISKGLARSSICAKYWDQCRDRGTRIFALRSGADRATAEYRFAASEVRFSLAQLRGPHNARASQAMDAFARAVETELNALERTPVRAALAATVAARRPHRRPAYRPPRRLDTESERELATVLASLRRPLADGELVRDFVAG